LTFDGVGEYGGKNRWGKRKTGAEAWSMEDASSGVNEQGKRFRLALLYAVLFLLLMGGVSIGPKFTPFTTSEANGVLKEVLAGFFIGHTQYHLIADVETLHYVRGYDDLSASYHGL